MEELSTKNLKQEIKEIKEKWQQLKKDKDRFPFFEYTDGLIKNLDHIKNDDLTLMFQGSNFIREIKHVHFTEKLSLSHVLTLSPTSQKIYYFHKYQDLMNDKEYWGNLAEAYSLQEFSDNEPYIIYMQLFLSPRPEKESIMTKEERAFLAELPDEITVFRGMSVGEDESGEYRFSWTLNEGIAANFAERNESMYDQETIVKEMIINKKDVVAYFDGREEQEIIYIPFNKR